MQTKLLFRVLFIKLAIFFNLYDYILCGNKWSYIKCKDYLNSLDIICTKIIKNENGTDFCDKWKVNNIIDILSFPNECGNKEYNVQLLVNNSKKLELILYVKKENLNNFPKKEVEKILKQKENVEKCLDILQQYQNNCQLTKNGKKNERECNDFENDEFIKFCSEIIFNTDESINNIYEKSKSNNTTKIKNKNFKQKNNIKKNFNNLFPEEEENINKKFIKNNEEKQIYNDIDKQNKKSEKRYFEGESRNKDNFDELEKGSSEDGKDCVEYGLNPLEEDIIICTKYE